MFLSTWAQRSAHLGRNGSAWWRLLIRPGWWTAIWSIRLTWMRLSCGWVGSCYLTLAAGVIKGCLRSCGSCFKWSSFCNSGGETNKSSNQTQFGGFFYACAALHQSERPVQCFWLLSLLNCHIELELRVEFPSLTTDLKTLSQLWLVLHKKTPLSVSMYERGSKNRSSIHTLIMTPFNVIRINWQDFFCRK